MEILIHLCQYKSLNSSEVIFELIQTDICMGYQLRLKQCNIGLIIVPKQMHQQQIY